MRVALDTNILVYAEGVNGISMKELALKLVERLPEGTTVPPVQTLGELFNVLAQGGTLSGERSSCSDHELARCLSPDRDFAQRSCLALPIWRPTTTLASGMR